MKNLLVHLCDGKISKRLGGCPKMQPEGGAPLVPGRASDVKTVAKLNMLINWLWRPL